MDLLILTVRRSNRCFKINIKREPIFTFLQISVTCSTNEVKVKLKKQK